MHVAHRVLIGKPERKIPLRRCRYRGGDNIKMDHQELEWQSLDWIKMTQDVVNIVKNF